jgi:LysM repeat protein
MADFTLGTTDPTITPDPGAGVWNSTPATAEFALKKSAILSILPHAALIVGPDAAVHMFHYLANTGNNFTIRLATMVADVPSGQFNYDEEVKEAAAFVETLPEGRHAFTSRSVNQNRAQPMYNTKGESWNWFFAIGGYSAWGKGEATVTSAGGVRRYHMTFRYKFFDRYNWDGGKKVEIFGITVTDHTMGEFHRQGMAKEFNCYGETTATFAWTHGGTPQQTSAPPPPVPLPQAPPPAPVKPHPTNPPPIPPFPVVPPAGAKTYTVKPGDSLSKIAKQFYGKASLWPRIYDANKAVIGANPNLIRPGQVFVIP